MAVLLAPAAPMQTIWKIDSLERIGGHKVTVEGAPKVIQTPAGKAVEFHSGKDALFLDLHPLEGALTFTWEVIFRPDSGGPAEQRFFHFQTRNEDTRMLFELRVRDGQWFIDTYVHSGAVGQTLMNTGHMHTLDQWHHAAAVYDGSEYRNYVDGVLERSAPVKLGPQGPGTTSIGTRINRRDYFKGAILMTRMTRRALRPEEFLKLPKGLR